MVAGKPIPIGLEAGRSRSRKPAHPDTPTSVTVSVHSKLCIC